MSHAESSQCWLGSLIGNYKSGASVTVTGETVRGEIVCNLIICHVVTLYLCDRGEVRGQQSQSVCQQVFIINSV